MALRTKAFQETLQAGGPRIVGICFTGPMSIAIVYVLLLRLMIPAIYLTTFVGIPEIQGF